MEVKNIYVDFQVLENRDPNTIVVYDTSEWAHILGKPTIIEITPPGFDKPYTNYFKQNQVNLFNSIDLGLTRISEGATSLPDGIYTITVKGSPDKFNHSLVHLKTDNIRLQLDSLLLKTNFLCSKKEDEEFIKKIRQIDLYIRAAEAHVRMDNSCSAVEYLTIAKQDLDKLSGCKSCI